MNEISANSKIYVSVVIPIYNEGENISPLYEELNAVLVSLETPYEVILVDDGSQDDSFLRLKEIHARDNRWKVIRFRRNFGQTAAFAAGFDQAAGEVVITIDADLQNDPHDIPAILKKMQEGFDIVSGWRMNRKEPLLTRRIPSISANWLISKLTGVSLHDYGCSLKAYRADVIKDVNLYGELHRFIPAIASWKGITIAEVAVNDRVRRFGKSKYGLDRTFKVFLDLLTIVFLLNFATRPIHIFGGLGLVTGLAGMFTGLYLTIDKLVYKASISNRPLLLLAILLVILGVQMVSMGLLAEMVMRVYNEAGDKKIYAVREMLV